MEIFLLIFGIAFFIYVMWMLQVFGERDHQQKMEAQHQQRLQELHEAKMIELGYRRPATDDPPKEVTDDKK